MPAPEQTKPQYTNFEIEFLKNVYLLKKVAEEEYRITDKNFKDEDGPRYGLQTRDFPKSTRPAILPRDTFLPQRVEDSYNKLVDKHYPDKMQNRVGIFLLPQSNFKDDINSEAGKKQLIAAFEKFGGIKYDSDYTYDVTRCGLDATTQATFYTKGTFHDSVKGIKNIFKVAENFVNKELSTQEKAILDLAIKKYVGSEASCGQNNVTGLESASLHFLINNFLSNNVRGGQEISADEVTRLNKQLANYVKGFDRSESAANDLIEFSKAAKGGRIK